MGAGTEVETDTAFMEYISRGRKTIRRKPLLPQHFIDRRHCLTGQESTAPAKYKCLGAARAAVKCWSKGSSSSLYCHFLKLPQNQ